jgi:hypothetical protein
MGAEGVDDIYTGTEGVDNKEAEDKSMGLCSALTTKMRGRQRTKTNKKDMCNG